VPVQLTVGTVHVPMSSRSCAEDPSNEGTLHIENELLCFRQRSGLEACLQAVCESVSLYMGLCVCPCVPNVVSAKS